MKNIYRIDDHFTKRRKALSVAIHKEQKKRNISLKAAALAKKYRLNVLRIYRKYRLPNECARITRDMMWIDKTYNTAGTTKNICVHS
jgi:hypothetical protein